MSSLRSHSVRCKLLPYNLCIIIRILPWSSCMLIVVRKSSAGEPLFDLSCRSAPNGFLIDTRHGQESLYAWQQRMRISRGRRERYQGLGRCASSLSKIACSYDRKVCKYYFYVLYVGIGHIRWLLYNSVMRRLHRGVRRCVSDTIFLKC
jgi:hypothetical protein